MSVLRLYRAGRILGPKIAQTIAKAVLRAPKDNHRVLRWHIRAAHGVYRLALAISPRQAPLPAQQPYRDHCHKDEAQSPNRAVDFLAIKEAGGGRNKWYRCAIGISGFGTP